ncbi:MAG: hypothetical protein H0W82_09420 [Actinobacteria bacterium]|nr:hypothetical protein [Actinomycetota bacterium]
MRTHLDRGENVVATGRCADVTERGGPEQGSAGWTYVMITDSKLRWVAVGNLAFEAALDLRQVTSFAERMVTHRYSIALKHPPLSRPRQVPAHRFLWFSWGNAVGRDPLTHTELAFSRRDTKAAQALRKGLGIADTAASSVIRTSTSAPTRRDRAGTRSPSYRAR